ncbi:MAG: hypothetical protein IPJ61_21610 [Tessaracoccus sp.]|uniref:hypothetical protein n=1 Tax=Tessaracoccus sp. TaxID=1971211 RepID=UPI001EC405E8|nr:hypothetical protein [Tessaracoccus sp.]MBK7823587.1 hypothetical protein [Tessaracoccus sp.]
MSEHPAELIAALNRRATAERVLREVMDERVRQHDKWGEQNHKDGTGPLLVWADRAAGAAVHAFRNRCEYRFRMGNGTWSDIALEEIAEALAEEDPALLRAELIQVAAVAVAWVEAIDRRADR